MKPQIFVRSASVLLFIHALLHTVGGVFGKIDPGPAAVAVSAMKSNQFTSFGNLRTFWDFYMGLGLAVSISLTMEAVVLWILAPLSVNSEAKLRPALAAFAIGYVIFAVNSFRYFFIGPVIVELLITACLLAAIATMQRKVVVSASNG